MYNCIRPDEWRANHSKYMKEHNPMQGKAQKDFMTEDAIIKWRDNISKARTGTHLSPESLAKRREKMRLKKLVS